MQRLRVLRTSRAACALLVVAALAWVAPAGRARAAAPTAQPKPAQPAKPKPAPPNAAAPATPGAKAPAASAASAAATPPKPPAQQVGEILAETTPFQRLLPQAGKTSLMPRGSKPLVLYFWATSANLAREELMALDGLVGKLGLAAKMDVVTVAGYKPDKQTPQDILEMAALLGLKNLPVILDPDYAMTTRLGVSQFPELVYVDKDGRILAKGVRALDHGHLGEPPQTASALMTTLAAKGTFPQLARTWPFYPSDRLLKRKYFDAELHAFSPEGYGRGKLTRLSSLLSGKRPAVIMFFSATCEHCQIDVPQIVKFMKAHPDAYDVVGVTRIKHATHRNVSTEYFKHQGITFPVLEDPGGFADLYKVTSTPTSYYLSPQGTIGSISYYQHDNLDKQWMALHPKLMGLPPPAPAAQAAGWKFPLKVKDASGKVIDLASMAGKPTILHYWATWCAPCRKELPDLVKRIPELSKNANVMMISVEDIADAPKIAKYQQETGLRFTSYLAPHDGLAKVVDFSRSVPRTYVLDASGNIDSLYHGTVEWGDPDRYTPILGRLVRR